MEKKEKTYESVISPQSYVDYDKNIPINKETGVIEKFPSDYVRFVDPKDRPEKTEIDQKTNTSILFNKSRVHYKGAPMMKDPLGLSVECQLLYEVKPKTIFEIGAYNGSSAMYFADYLKSSGIKDFKLYTHDYNDFLISPQVKEYSNIQYVKCDVNKETEAFPDDLLKNAPHPWVIIEDCHVNIEKVLSRFNSFMKEGDYMIIEDLTPYQMEFYYNPLEKDSFSKISHEMTEKKQNFFTKWVEKENKDNEAKLFVDSYYTDFYGVNFLNMMNGILRKMK